MHSTWRHLCQSTNAAPSFPLLLWSCYTDFTSIGMTMRLDQPQSMIKFLVFCDHFMKHVMAYVTPDQTAKSVAKFLWWGCISIFRALAKLLSDWGTNFGSDVIKELCELIGIWKARTLPYHAQTNGQVEQVHGTHMHMIGKLSKDQKADCPNIYQSWYMLTTLWDWPSWDTAHTTWCLDAGHAYLLTFMSP